MICPNCQKNIPDNSSFCTYCGAALSMGAESVNPYAVGVQTGSSYSANYDPNAPDIPGFVGAIKTCFRKYCVFRGRASRSEYWYWILFIALINFVLVITTAAIDDEGSAAALILSLVGRIFGIVIFLPAIGVAVRRLHDIGKSGWWWWINWIPFIGTLILLVFYIRASDIGPNQYGAQPVKRV